MRRLILITILILAMTNPVYAMGWLGGGGGGGSSSVAGSSGKSNTTTGSTNASTNANANTTLNTTSNSPSNNPTGSGGSVTVAPASDGPGGGSVGSPVSTPELTTMLLLGSGLIGLLGLRRKIKK